MPRPKKTDDLQIRVAPAEKALIQAAADAAGEALSVWARRHLLRAARRQTQPPRQAA